MGIVNENLKPETFKQRKSHVEPLFPRLHRSSHPSTMRAALPPGCRKKEDIVDTEKMILAQSV